MAYSRKRHAFAVLTACATFLLIIAGALVTSNDAGLAVPDWPTSFGSLYRIPPMVGGVKYEHGHRMVAQFIGLLTIVLALWTWRVERRGWMRKLGFVALAIVIAQGILGGITVLYYLPPLVSSAHATLAQTFFSLLVAMAVFTSRGWVAAMEQPVIAADARRPSLRTLSILSMLAVYVQLVLGAAFRHSGMKLLPHLISAVVVTVLLVWTSIRVLSEPSAVPPLRRTALLVLSLLIVQLGLGFGAYLTRVEWGRDAPQPMIEMVATTVAHVAVGALLLAVTVILTLYARRYTLRTATAEVTMHPSEKAVMA
jgi:cytochrome c oxidase assembly protein subunit 15